MKWPQGQPTSRIISLIVVAPFIAASVSSKQILGYATPARLRPAVTNFAFTTAGSSNAGKLSRSPSSSAALRRPPVGVSRATMSLSGGAGMAGGLLGGHGIGKPESSRASKGAAGTARAVSSSAEKKAEREADDMPLNRISRTSATTLSQVTGALFASLDIHPATKDALQLDMRYANMTMVQEQTIPVSVTGVDVIAKAKTGTGKTLAFLIPAIEKCVEEPRQKGAISSLIISPTRELAQQIQEEAEMLANRHSPKLKVMCIVGGTNMNRDLKGFENPPDILIATPGRLNDHLENQNLPRMLKKLRCLIFDEADQLLDMGFRPAIQKVMAALPPKATRQTLLFSATLPDDVKAMSELATRPGDQTTFIDTVGEEENTHQHVDQEYVVTTIQEQPLELYRVLKEAMAEDDKGFKIIAFFTTARQTQLFAELFNILGFPVLEIHSRLSQPARKRVSDEFRNSKGRSIMFSSDVSARGLDYPDVTKVIQVRCRPCPKPQPPKIKPCFIYPIP